MHHAVEIFMQGLTKVLNSDRPEIFQWNSRISYRWTIARKPIAAWCEYFRIAGIHMV
jgi:hypothetical protein